MTFREKAACLARLTRLSDEEHEKLRADGARDHRLWSDGEYQNKELVDRFRQEVKSHYFWHQGRRCCYCSVELQHNARAFDAEHILDKSGYPEFMFHTENLAVACVICNSHKSAKSVLSDEVIRPKSIPTDSADYKILHPHLDEWNHHLRFDEIGRIVPVDGSIKGPNTILICAMDGINLQRLAMAFAPASRESAYELMCKVVEYKSPGKIAQTLALMRQLAEQSPEAHAVVSTLEERMAHMQHRQALEEAAFFVEAQNPNDAVV